MKMWNEGHAHQRVMIELMFAWLDNALEVPIDERTWSRVLFVLELLPIDEHKYGDLKLGVKLSEGKDGRQYVAIADGKRAIFADGSEVAMDEQAAQGEETHALAPACEKNTGDWPKQIKIGDQEMTYEVSKHEETERPRRRHNALPRRRRCGRRFITSSCRRIAS